MSVNYSAGLSPYPHKGVVGLPEKFDDEESISKNVDTLITYFKECKHIVVHTGAGISTSAGIPDFRGPNGVWTLEKKGISPQVDITFENAIPTRTHMALLALEKAGFIKHVITQNIDGLHVRSGFPRNRLSELHGNMFVEQCDKCHTQFIGEHSVSTMALNYTGNPCLKKNTRGTLCRGRLKDTILDWEDALPYFDLTVAEDQCRKADLSLCLGTSLQINPSGNLPLLTRKNGGKLAVVNLQPTRHDKLTDIRIHGYVDDVMDQICRGLNIAILRYSGPQPCLLSSWTLKHEKRMNVMIKTPEVIQDNVTSDDFKYDYNEREKKRLKVDESPQADRSFQPESRISTNGCLNVISKEILDNLSPQLTFHITNNLSDCEILKTKV